MSDIIVLIPHFNNFIGLTNSIKSMNSEFEFIDILAIDDGSNEALDESYLQSIFGVKITVLNNKVNRGIEHVLNDGLTYAIQHNYKYIGRLDCGDLCKKDRFRIQYDFLEKHTDIGIVGSHVKCVDQEGTFLYNLKMPLKDEIIRKKMFFNAMLIHPTLFFRSEIIHKVGLYPTEYKNAEDYAFFFKILPHFKFANIDKELVQIELNTKGISATGREKQIKSRISLIKENFYFGFYPIMGFLRSILILKMPNGVIEMLKNIFFNKK